MQIGQTSKQHALLYALVQLHLLTANINTLGSIKTGQRVIEKTCVKPALLAGDFLLTSCRQPLTIFYKREREKLFLFLSIVRGQLPPRTQSQTTGKPHYRRVCASTTSFALCARSYYPGAHRCARRLQRGCAGLCAVVGNG